MKPWPGFWSSVTYYFPTDGENAVFAVAGNLTAVLDTLTLALLEEGKLYFQDNVYLCLRRMTLEGFGGAAEVAEFFRMESHVYVFQSRGSQYHFGIQQMEIFGADAFK